ncbi:MAG: hypothetical protein LBQ58_02700 [Synergistaceae bacterium]|nr:hypothetical protein [Synergistaceae bacterium]
MKTIAINGSPRKNWNTAKILMAALVEAKSVEAETELFPRTARFHERDIRRRVLSKDRHFLHGCCRL